MRPRLHASAAKAGRAYRARHGRTPPPRSHHLSVLTDVNVPADPADAATLLDPAGDRPSTVTARLTWLAEAGFTSHLPWQEHELVVLVGDLR